MFSICSPTDVRLEFSANLSKETQINPENHREVDVSSHRTEGIRVTTKVQDIRERLRILSNNSKQHMWHEEMMGVRLRQCLNNDHEADQRTDGARKF